MSGVVIVEETRETVDLMTSKYLERYKELLTDDKKESFEDIKREVLIDDITCHVALLFTEQNKKIFGKQAVKTAKPVITTITDDIATSENKEQETPRIDAHFVNEQFKVDEYSIIDNDMVKNANSIVKNINK